jgi:hypothetical protein
MRSRIARTPSLNSPDRMTAFDSEWSRMNPYSLGWRRKLMGTTPQPALKQANIDSSVSG